MKTEKQIAAKKHFAGEAKLSMKRRDDHNDYSGRRMYMITMEVEHRRPLFGKVVGNPEAAAGSAEAPHMELSPLGTAVQAEWRGIPRYYPQIEIMAVQMMPDHIHGILFVHEQLPVHLGQVMAGFKKGCERKWKAIKGIADNSAYADNADNAAVQPQPTPNSHMAPSLAPSAAQNAPYLAHSAAQDAPSLAHSPSVPSQAAAMPQQSLPPQHAPSPRLFALGYNDLLLKNYDEFQTWKRYLADNPRRLLLKRARPDLLRVRLDVDVCGRTCSAVGNLALLSAPEKLRVRISRSIDPALLEQEKARLLAAARAGAVLVSPAISPGEKAVTRAAFDEGLPLIVLLDNGLAPIQKPLGRALPRLRRGPPPAPLTLPPPQPQSHHHASGMRGAERAGVGDQWGEVKKCAKAICYSAT